MVRKILDNIIIIKYMAAERWNLKVATVIGANSGKARSTDMEHGRVLLVTGTSGNS